VVLDGFTTESDYRWKWKHQGIDWKEILGDLKVALKVTGEAIGVLSML
jgi:hypothetical protein